MSFRARLLLLSGTVAGLAALAVFLAGGAVIRSSVTDRVTGRLEREALLLEGQLSADGVFPRFTAFPRDIALADALADQAGRALGLRVTIIAADGRVLGDSSLEPTEVEAVENHANRPEILQAGLTGTGSSSRWSATIRDNLLYIARRVDSGGQTAGYVRLSVPLREIGVVSERYSALLAILSLGGFLVVAVIGYVATRRFSKPIEEMSVTAELIASGRRDLEVEYGPTPEFGRLGAAINRLTRSLSEQVGSLSAEKRLLDTIVAGMKEGLLVVDMEKRVLLSNPAFLEIAGLPDHDLVGRPLIEILRDADVIRGYDTALGRGEEFRSVFHTSSGPDRAFDLWVAPLTDPTGRQIGAIGLFFDVTRLDSLERVRREFVANVSHELRTPLTSVKAFVETLLSGGIEDSENNRRFLEIVQKHALRMEAILDDLTDLSLIETGAVNLEIETLDPATLARDLVESLRPAATARDVTLRMEIETGVHVRADRRRLEQILLNLLDNAVKFNRPGGSVTLRITTLPGPVGSARLVVEDTGIGIPAEAREKVFNRFYRVDRERSREMGGTGLGLSIVRHLVNLLGGTIRLESEFGRGSRFIIDLRGRPA